MWFCSLSDLILEPFRPQNGARERKRENVKIELSLRRELDFRGYDPSKPPKKRQKKLSHTHTFFYALFPIYWPILGAVRASKSIKQHLKSDKKHINPWSLWVHDSRFQAGGSATCKNSSGCLYLLLTFLLRYKLLERLWTRPAARWKEDVEIFSKCPVPSDNSQ